MKKYITFILLFTLGLAWFFGYKQISKHGTEQSLDFIASHISGQGKLIDYQNDLGVKDISDIKWYNNKSNIEIEFGRVRLKFDKKEFESDKVVSMLKRINIKIKKSGDEDEYKLYYGDQKIDLYVR